MSYLEQRDFESDYLHSTGSMSSAGASRAGTLKSSIQYFQELVLILGIQLLFRASLMLRRLNY